MRTRDPKTLRILLGLSILLILACTLLTVQLLRERPPASVWKGYYTLLVRRSVEAERVLEGLAAEGLSSVLSEGTARVEIQAYSGMEEVALTELPERLDELDPRYDPYLREIASIFRTSDGLRDYALYYIAADRGLLELRRALRRAFRGVSDEWSLLEWQAGGKLLLLLPFLLGLIVLLRHLPKSRLSLLAAAPAWMPAILLAGSGALLTALGLLFSLGIFLSRAPERRLYRYFHGEAGDLEGAYRASLGFFLLWFLAGAIHALVLQPAQLLPVILALVVSGLVPVARLLLLQLRVLGRGHRPFLPVSLRPDPPRRDGAATGRLALRMAVLMVLGLLPALLGGLQGSPPIPQPVEIGEGRMTLPDIRELRERPGALPDISDYLAHRAFQEGLMYDRAYGFPGENETITLSEYRSEEGSMRARERVVLSFDEEWLQQTLAQVPADRPAALFVTQGVPAGVEMRSVPALYSSRSQVIQNSTLLLLVLVPFIYRHRALRPRVRQGVSYVVLRAQRQGV